MRWPLLLLLNASCVAYLVYAGFTIVRTSARARPWVVGGLVPLGVTASMDYLFLVVGFATTVQFNVGDPARMNAWSTWVDVWPALLCLTAGVAVAGLVWTVLTVLRPGWRTSRAAAVSTTLLSALAFLTVLMFFPSA